MHLFTFVAIISLITGVLSICVDYNYRNICHRDKCVYRELGLSPGEQRQPWGRCECFYCAPGQRGLVESCNEIIVNPPCRVGGFTNPNATFPYCCQREVICPVY
uniref:Putative secreted protein n=1 Tax=Haematobia irritans TaxID=7368 RepID=A0A1L8E999_HAEIR